MTTRKERALSLLRLGYDIIPVEQGQKRPTFSGWQNYRATEELIASWSNQGNIGLLTARTPAVDLDIRDDGFASEMEQFIRGEFGAAPVRVGNAPKRLLVFAADKPFRKMASGRFECELGGTHQVEILGVGQQCVIYGTHPTTQKPYKWTSEALHEQDMLDLPVLTVENAQRIIAEFERRAEARGWTRKGRATEVAEDDDLDFLRPKVDVSEDELREALKHMPGAEHYDIWVKVGAALHDHFDGSETGFELWDAWSSQAPNYSFEAIEAKWKSFGKYTGRKTTVAYILGETKEARAKIKAETKVVAARTSFEELNARIASTEDFDALMTTVAREISESEVAEHHRESLVHALHVRVKQLGHKISVNVVRKAVEGKGEAKPAKVPVESKLSFERDLAQRVLDAHFGGGKRLKRFSKMWWSYREGRWTRADDETVEKAVMETLLNLEGEGDEKIASLLARIDESRGDRMTALTGTITKALALLVAEEGNDDPLNLLSFDTPRVMNFRNGELWFDENGNTTFRKHDPKNNLTFRLECDYDPDATCPTWDAALARVTKNNEDSQAVVDLIHEVFGYIAQPTRDCATWVMFKGPGGNGKSFISDVLSALMGKDTVLARSIAEISNGAGAHFGDSLVGKNMLLDDDYRTGSLLPDDWLKRLSEAKLVTANPKFGRTFEFKARAIPVILTNNWPSTVDLSEGLRRRAVIIETNYVLKAEEKDPAHKRTILQKELSGVANQLIAGFVRFLKRGSRFDLPGECVRSRELWMQSGNTTALFVGTVLERTDPKKEKIAGEVLYDVYKNWLRTNEHNAKELGRSKFYDAIEKLGVDRSFPGGKCHFWGVRVKRVEGTEFFFSDDL